MKVIAGLGNPGNEYAKTRHNAGFMLVDALAAEIGASAWKEKFQALVAEGRIGSEKVLLVKPQTYMNLSGEAIGPLLAFYKLPVEDLTVVHDDLDLVPGLIRIRHKGSSGGHNGLKSIISHVGSENFSRVRIGIGHPEPGRSVADYVTSPFNAEEAKGIQEAIVYLLPAMQCLVTAGVDMAMNKYNPKKNKKKKQEEE